MTRTRGRPPSGGREQILRATLDLLREQGVAKLTTRAVAEMAGVSEGSIFYHFGDRAGLLTSAFQHTLGPMRLESDSLDTDVRSALIRISVGVQQFLESGLVVLVAAQADADLRERLAAFMRENDYGPHRGVVAVAAYLGERQAAGDIRADVEPRVVATMLINDAFQRAAVPTLVGHARGRIPRATFVDTLMTMLAPPSGATDPEA
ncbi:TetR/AcrR family transcriptional regulator [Solicola gregarius]|uniref:TetR/AcrR family transcriptional regulator n=1 Tax=Solicola gregarius TaxID=2908642 RepID=A0AA46YPQ0_9ACTN|nr:TetR/AcrR family transcriptional regulator [Solicola gregarius]UYM07843.1 TetR/AcrR family transcriptional regulator [Solicola gregarius]